MVFERAPRAGAGQARLFPLGLAGVLALVIAQSCKGDAGGADGSGGSDGAGGSVDGSGGQATDGGSGGTPGPATGGASGAASGGSASGGYAGEDGLGGEGGALGMGRAPESGVSMIWDLSPGVLAGVILINRPAACTDFTAARVTDAYWGSSSSLYLTIGDDAAALEPGAYSVDGLPDPESGHYGTASLVLHDAECNLAPQTAIGGFITLSEVDGNQLSGSYDLVFADGTLQGTLAPEHCPGFEWTGSQKPLVCW